MSGAAQAAYAKILNAPANANNVGVQILKQYLPASSFKLMGAQLFAAWTGSRAVSITPTGRRFSRASGSRTSWDRTP